MMRLLLLMIGLFSSWLIAATPSQQHPHIEVQLVTEQTNWQPGQRYWIGLAMRPHQHWHTYWKNPGDSGIPTKLSFSSNEPEVDFGNIAWPTPERIVISDITNFGYYGNSLLMVPVDLPTDLSKQTLSHGLTIKLSASWLVCKESCIPGSADFQLSVPITLDDNAKATEYAALFTSTRQLLPLSDPDISLNFNISNRDFSKVQFQLSGIDESHLQLDLFAADESFLAAAATPLWRRGTDTKGRIIWQTELAASDYFDRLPEQSEIVLRNQQNNRIHSLQVIANQAALAELTFANSMHIAAQRTIPEKTELSVLLLALMALAGGVLLNLMPCVFPVLSLKALSLVKLSGQALPQARRQGILYLLGILLSLFAIGLLLSALKQAGHAIGWGFQLQNPWFLAVLTLVMVFMATSLLGVFEVAGSWMSIGSNRLARSDDSASLLSGCLAVVVASPCMTPLMAPALGVALTLPFISMLFVLMALGLGLALPILVLTMWPALSYKMPKPGPWLETFKQALAFPLFLTAIWLLWLLQQHDPNWVLLLLIVVLVIAFCGWLNRRNHPYMALTVLILAFSVPATWYFKPSNVQSQLVDRAIPYSAEKLQRLIDEGQPVFINMTADWCLTCKVNERVTFKDPHVGQVFEQLGVIYMVGDWTHRNSQISAYLDKFQHAGVPLYVLYDQHGTPHLLPQLLTPNNTIEYLQTTLETELSPPTLADKKHLSST